MIFVASVQDKQAAFAELQLKYEGSEKRVHKLMAQLQDAEAAAPGNQVCFVLWEQLLGLHKVPVSL